MKKLLLSLLAASVVYASCKDQASNTDAAATTTDSSTVSTPEKTLSPEEQQKAWMNYMTPGEVHQMLAKQDGEWQADITMWMGPDSPAIKNTGVAMNKMILGGRYQESKHKGEFMGMPFEGVSLLGYDNAKKAFVSSWIDNMGTGMMQMEGTWDDKTKTINFKGKMVDPTTGKDTEIRETVIMMDDQSQKMEMFCMKDGKEFKSMEIMLKKKS